MLKNEKEKFYITTAIAYASRKPHIGNTYEVIMTDAVARFKRQTGYDVFFLTGTDEHGQKIENCAKEAGVDPQTYVDGVSGEIRGIWDLMNTSYDKFIRTTDAQHVSTVQHMFKKFFENGDIYKGAYEGWYCVPDESFFTDTQVVDGKCPECGRPVVRMSEEAYFFRMSKYADRLIRYIEEHPDFIEPESRKKEMVNNFLNAGLQDLCVSRSSFKWGIPVTFDEKHVVYVWLDALSNYITALGYDVGETSDLYRKYWPADVHVIGKDILRFHTIYWPIFLMALGEPLPKKVFGHPWFNFGADKMSKSRGNVIYADDLVARFGVDAVRHYCLSEMPYASDGSITYENIINRYNTDLANNLGNLVKRTLSMTQKYFDGVVPAPGKDEGTDGELKQTALETEKRSFEYMNAFHVADALNEIFLLFRRANKYIDETSPWTLAKEENKERLGTVIYNLLESIRIGAILLNPFLTKTSDSILDQLNTDVRGYESARSFGGLVPGGKIGEILTLFERLDEKQTLDDIQKETESKTKKTVEKPTDIPENMISIDDFRKMDLRSAKVIACEAVPKAKKLLKLTVDLGYETRCVVSGIARDYRPENLVGKIVVLVANLSPATICGIESNGMILAFGKEKINVVFLPEGSSLGEKIC